MTTGRGWRNLSMTKWLQAIRQSTTYLGVAVIAIIWGGIYLLAFRSTKAPTGMRYARRQSLPRSGRIHPARRSGIRQRCWNCGGNTRKTHNISTSRLGRAQPVAQCLTVQFGIADADGFVILSSLRPLGSSVYVGDRAPFTDPRDNKEDQLYISDPVVGHVTKKLTIEFVRRMTNPMARSRRRGELARHCGAGEVLQFARPWPIRDRVAGRHRWHSSGAWRPDPAAAGLPESPPLFAAV